MTHTAIGLVSVVSLSFIFYFLFEQALIQRTSYQLSSINVLKKNNIEEYLNETQKNLELEFGHKSIQSPSLGNTWQNELALVKQLYDFKAILIVDTTWNRVMSTTEDSLLTSVVDAFHRKAQPVTQFQILEASSFVDIDATILVYALPMVAEGQLSGYIFIEDDFGTIQRIVREIAGMGNTGESYLVGPDFLLRSRSRFFPERSPRSIEVKTELARSAFSGIESSGITHDYRGVKVLSVCRKVDSPYLRWIVVSEIDYDEAMLPIQEGRNYILLAMAIILLVIIGITYFISNAISKPILQLNNTIVELSKGVIPTKSTQLNDTSELGQIARAIDELVAGLKRTTQFADEIGAGQFDASYVALSNQDTLGNALIQMRDKLKALSEEQARLIREKASALMEGQENERKRIVQDLHDGVGQLLTGIRLRVQMMEEDEKLKNEIMALINETIAEVKRVSYNLMPNALVDFGLEAALRGLCDHVKKYTSLDIDFNYVKESDRVQNFDVSIAVFRIVQEGFNNIMKHAAATQVDLYVLAHEHELYVLLKDNGRGFDATSKSSSGFGLRNMNERTKLLNGTFELHSQAGQGTSIEVTIPLV